MRLLKKQVLLRFINSYVVDSPQPANIYYLWNFGSLLATCLGLQILTGIFLAMHYIPNVDLAFTSVEHMTATKEINLKLAGSSYLAPKYLSLALASLALASVMCSLKFSYLLKICVL